MKYRQLDRITALEPGKRLTAERRLLPNEEYLKDHFPLFPVMPGVMMLEALHQAAVWMIKTGDQFRTPLVLLREVKSVKFGDFLCPGETLEISVEAIKDDGNQTTVKATASKQGRVTVSARLVLERCNTDEPEWLAADHQVRSLGEQQFRELFGDIAMLAGSHP
jgi:3-hydroxyacyl-[acyl-carrier-protein] dehydratase